MDTRSLGPKFRFEIRRYNPYDVNINGTTAPPAANSTAVPYQTLGALIAECYMFYDVWNLMLIDQNKWIYTEDIERYVK